MTEVAQQQMTETTDDRDYLTPRERLTQVKAQAHSRRVQRLRLVIPALAAGLLGTYALSATPPQIDQQFLNNFTQLESGEPLPGDGLRLDRPRYAGEDLEGTPFEVAAAYAVRDADNPDRIALNNPTALRQVSDGSGNYTAATVNAAAGMLDTAENLIDLRDDVQLSYALGGAPLVVETEAARVDLNDNIVRTTSAAHGQSDRGTVAAERATAYQGEDRLVLNGNVRIRLNGADRAEKKKDVALR